jgi:HK97 family phage portal protein
MSWLSNIFTTKAKDDVNIQSRGMSIPGGDVSYNMLSDTTVITKEAEVMAIATAHRCMSVVADTVATLSGKVYKDGKEADDHLMQKLWFSQPNNLYNAFILKRQLILNYQNLGNGFAVCQRDSKGMAIRWDFVRSMRPVIHEGEKYYYDGLSDNIYDADDVIHMINVGTSPHIGTSKIQQNQLLFGKSKASLQYTNKMYSNNMFLGGVIQYPENIKMTPEKADQISQSAKVRYGGLDKAGGLFILDQGGILKQFENSMPLSDAEYVLSERLTNEDICRIYGVPPFMAFEYNKMSGESMEAAKITFVETTILPIITQLEQEINNKAFKYEKNTKIKHSIKSLLRADIKSQADYWSKMASIGKYTINELRALDDQPPVEGGDVAFIQANNYFPLSKMEDLSQAKIDELVAKKEKLNAEAENIDKLSGEQQTNETPTNDE